MDEFFDVSSQIITTSKGPLADVAMAIRDYLYSGVIAPGADTNEDSELTVFKDYVDAVRSRSFSGGRGWAAGPAGSLH